MKNIFKDEVKRSYESNSEVPRRMVEYLLGEYDFYKVVSVDAKKITQNRKIQKINFPKFSIKNSKIINQSCNTKYKSRKSVNKRYHSIINIHSYTPQLIIS